ncbi:MAG: hypothetical protein HYS06_02085 [Methylocystis sp.]|nr:hypothetical protein [Methylocystis sp.]
MFGWFKKKQSPESAFTEGEVRDLKSKLDAYVNDYIKALNEHVHAKYDSVFQAHYCVLKRNIESALQQNEMPHIGAAGRAYKDFLDQIDNLKAGMESEIALSFRNWLATAEKIGVRDLFDNYRKSLIDKFNSDLKEAAEALLAAKANDLTAADMLWRAANPEKAKLYP